MIYFISKLRVTFTLPAAGCVFRGLRRGGGGAYGWGQVRSGTAASSLPAEPVAASLRGLKHMLYKLFGSELWWWRRWVGEAGGVGGYNKNFALPTWIYKLDSNT